MANMMRRRFLAALGAVGLAAPARTAQAASCVVQDMDGSYLDPRPVYYVSANRAQFAVPADIKAIAPEGAKVTLAAAPERGGTGVSGTALIKGELTRNTASETPTIKQVSFEWPVTVLDTDGKYNTIVGMAYEQNVQVGLRLVSGDAELGSLLLTPETYQHHAIGHGFNEQGGQSIHDALMSGKVFKLELVAGGAIYSRLELGTNVYSDFVSNTVLPEMNRAAQLDADGGCDTDGSDYGGGYYGMPCFLTTACCSVVGLADDCWELTMLRRLRDDWMAGFAAGRADISRYRRNAPAIAQKLGASAKGRRRLLRLYWSVIVPAAIMIGLGMRRAPYRLYRRMMVSLGA